MADLADIRESVLEIVSGRLDIPREVYELRYNLFFRAATYYFNQQREHKKEGDEENCEVIEPFPSCFYDPRTKTRNYYELELCVSNIPTLCEIDVRFLLFIWTMCVIWCRFHYTVIQK